MLSKPHFEALQKVIEKAGEQARTYVLADAVENEQKADGSVVTAVDEAVERELVSYIKSNFPDDSIVGEEGGDHVGTSGYVWHIDPIDGTDNFLRKIPFCAISVARLGDTKEDSLAIIHNPITGMTFSGLVDEGVQEGERIHEVNNKLLGGRAIISVSRGRESWMKSAGYNLKKALGLKFGKSKEYGCCALEHAYLAANRIDGVLTFGLHSYDYAAGLYLIQLGGGSISVFRDGAWQLWTSSIKELCQKHGESIFASHAGIHADALALIGDPYKWRDGA